MAATRTVRLSWTASPSPADGPPSDVVAYEVARSDGAPNPVAVVGTSAGSPYDDERPYGAWSYRVRAVDGAGNRSAWTATASVVVSPLSPLVLVLGVGAVPRIRAAASAGPALSLRLDAAPRLRPLLTTAPGSGFALGSGFAPAP